MTLDGNEYQHITAILAEELVPALGCTEPISIAYAGAHLRSLLAAVPDRVCIKSSGNIIKNVKSVIVPNSGGMKGIPAAAAIGIIAGNPAKGLEVLADVTEEDIAKAADFLRCNSCTVSLLDTPASLHFIIEGYSGTDYASVEIIHQHTNIVRMIKNGTIVQDKPFTVESSHAALKDRSILSVEKILAFADTVDLDTVKEILERQIIYNMKVAAEGLQNKYGANVGKNLLDGVSEEDATIKIGAAAAAAAASDARMGGCTLPVITNSGSGNQGLAASIPVIIFAKKQGLSHQQLLRGLVVSNLIAIHQKTKIGWLSAYCGAVSAACGSGAAMTYLSNGSYQQVCDTITNTLAVISGMVCDGAKASCAGKIAVAVEAAVMAHSLAMHSSAFQAGDGLVKNTVEQTIAGIGRMATEGMRTTDKVILQIMVDD